MTTKGQCAWQNWHRRPSGTHTGEGLVPGGKLGQKAKRNLRPTTQNLYGLGHVLQVHKINMDWALHFNYKQKVTATHLGPESLVDSYTATITRASWALRNSL